MKIRFTTILFLIFMQANAHESGDWCDSENIKTVGQVTMSESVLKNLSHGVVCSIPVVDFDSLQIESSEYEISRYISRAVFRERQHGELDELDREYMSTLAYAYCSCSEYSGQTEIDPRKTRPKFIDNTITSLAHHADFRYTEGVTFSCQVCRTSLQ